MKDTALAAAKEMIKTMEGLADGLQERLRRTEAKNEALRKELEKYSEEERKQMYESVMKFFEKLYDIPQEEETEGLEELDTAAADEFQDFETESLDIEDLG